MFYRNCLRIIAMSLAGLAVASIGTTALAQDRPDPRVERAWPGIDWSTAIVPPSEIISGGVPRDGIPPVYTPSYEPIEAADIPGSEPVIGLEINGEARAYPLRYMTAHEIVNDRLGGRAIAVTYCPLCNAAIVFDREFDGTTHRFGVSGLLRKSDLIMWDHESESLWQQFAGQAIAGPRAGDRLETIPSRLESLEAFTARLPHGDVLAPPRRNFPYGNNPYVGYDALNSTPFLYRGDMPDGIAPMQRVVVVGQTAWSLGQVREAGEITEGDIRLRAAGLQNSALDTRRIAEGRDVASVIVERRDATGEWKDAAHHVTFAFVFHAFQPDGTWRFGPNAQMPPDHAD